MKYKKSTKLLWIIMIISITISIFPLAVYGNVTDISDHWAKDVITQWIEKGLAKGYTDGTFRPKNHISRAEFMNLVNSAFGYTEEKEINYSDVLENKWYVSTIKKAAAAGYINGYTDGSMKPDNPITREEVAVIIVRIMKLDLNEKGTEGFKDKDKIRWSKGYVGAVASAKYMVGTPDGNFNPLNNITRGEAIYALNNIIMNKKEPKGVQAVAKQDFLGITYIQVIWNRGVKPSAIKANGQDLTYDNNDRKWKGTSLELKIGDTVEIIVIENGMEVKETIIVKDILDN